jgi:hypothetical protein
VPFASVDKPIAGQQVPDKKAFMPQAQMLPEGYFRALSKAI